MLSKKTCVIIGAATLALFISGCKSTSPMMLQMPTAKKAQNILPLKLGVKPIQKKGSSSISDTSLFIFPGFYRIDARMPRRNEKDYALQSIRDHINDTGSFKSAYLSPYNPEHVDLQMVLKFEEFKYSNNGFYAFVANFPYIQLLQFIGLPQDKFNSVIKVTCDLENKDGKVIKSYMFESTDGDWVSIYEQPYGNYMWYDSVYRSEFNKMMNYFYDQIRKDKETIMQSM